MEVVIITGLSGAGKTKAVEWFEDKGYYCVDNIPPVMISTFYELSKNSSDQKLSKIAVVTNVRDSSDYKELSKSLTSMKLDGAKYEIGRAHV